MSQEKIIEWLKLKRKHGHYYTIKQIANAVNSNECTTWRQINKLYAYDFLEIKVESIVPMKRKFRLKNG